MQVATVTYPHRQTDRPRTARRHLHQAGHTPTRYEDHDAGSSPATSPPEAPASARCVNDEWRNWCRVHPPEWRPNSASAVRYDNRA